MDVTINNCILPLDNLKGILLDLDNTVYSYAPVHEAALKACASYSKINARAFEQLYHNARKYINDALIGTGASHNRLLYFQYMSEQLFCRSDMAWSLDMYNLYWDTSIESMQLFEWVIPALNAIRQSKIKVCVITDLTVHIQMRKIVHLKLDKLIDFLVTSEEAGEEKPSPKIFNLALSKMGFSPKECVMIGDNPEKDGDGANRVGVKAVLV